MDHYDLTSRPIFGPEELDLFGRFTYVLDYEPFLPEVVLPEHRNNGYLDDILAECTRILAAQEVPRIRAATDLGNVPMANAFRRAGYVTFERTITMTWP